MSTKVISVLFGKPAIYIQVPRDHSLLNEVEGKVLVSACLHELESFLLAVPLPITAKAVVGRKLWRYKVEVEQKTTDAGEENLLFRIIRRKKFLLF